MTSPINLNKARKARDLKARKTQADENAVRHGLTKAQRVLAAAKADLAQNKLDGAQFEDE